MLCAKFGVENPADARFCGKCGDATTSGPPGIRVSPAAAKPAARDPGSKKTGLNVPILLAAAAVVIVFMGGLGVLLVLGRKPSNPNPAPIPASDVVYEPPPSQTKSAYSAPPGLLLPNNDAVYRDKVIGIWGVKRIIVGAFVEIKCSFLPGERATRSGSYISLGTRYPLSYSGTWEVKDGYFRTVIESPNILQVIPVGMTGASKLVSINDEEWIYVDLSEGQTQTVTPIQSSAGPNLNS